MLIILGGKGSWEEFFFFFLRKYRLIQMKNSKKAKVVFKQSSSEFGFPLVYIALHDILDFWEYCFWKLLIGIILLLSKSNISMFLPLNGIFIEYIFIFLRTETFSRQRY